MHTWTITREARRIVRETQYVLIDAATEEEAIEAARATSDSVWLEQAPAGPAPCSAYF